MALLIFLYPFCEIYAWYKFIEYYSFLDALYILITGGVLGSIIMTLQGRAALVSLLNTLQNSTLQNKPPMSIFHRALIWFGGLFIFLPGLISKFIGTAFVLPGTRHLIIWYIKSSLIAKISTGTFRIFMSGTKGFQGRNNTWNNTDEQPFPSAPPPQRDVIEVTPLKVEHKNHDNKKD